MSDWQPIESAPKDGTRILLFEPRDDEHAVELGFWDASSWYAPLHVYTIYPTHWMPLPNPPISGSGGDNRT